MRKVKVKARAKVNLTLDVFKAQNGYHPLKSLVSSIDLYDEIVIKRRDDDKITLVEKGFPTCCELENNNAYKAAKAFKEKFSTSGVDIIVNKKIIVGGGLGGSSADIAGVINGMRKLFKVENDGSEISNELASDGTYLLKGGYAVLSDRGNTVKYLDCDKTLYLLLITNRKPISAKQGYDGFDVIGEEYDVVTDNAVEGLLSGNDELFYNNLHNRLYYAALRIIPTLTIDIEQLKSVGSKVAVMSGSGSTVYGVFDTKGARDYAYNKLKVKYGSRLIKSKTEKY